MAEEAANTTPVTEPAAEAQPVAYAPPPIWLAEIVSPWTSWPLLRRSWRTPCTTMVSSVVSVLPSRPSTERLLVFAASLTIAMSPLTPASFRYEDRSAALSLGSLQGARHSPHSGPWGQVPWWMVRSLQVRRWGQPQKGMCCMLSAHRVGCQVLLLRPY